MSNILIVTALFPPEPVVSAMISYDLAEKLSVKHDVTVISPPPSRPPGHSFSTHNNNHNRFKHIVFESAVRPESTFLGRLYESHSFGKSCATYIKKHHKEIDVIYMNTWPMAAQYYTVKASRKYKIPIITHIQDVYPESLVNKLRYFKRFFYAVLLPVDKYIIRKSTKVIAISEGMQQLLTRTRNVSDGKIALIYNWQDFAKIVRAPEAKRHNKFIFMYLGSISASSSLDVVIQAFANSGLHNSKLIIAGEGQDKEKLIKFAENYQKVDIEFIKAPAACVGELQSMADVCILPLKKGVSKLAMPSKLPAYMFSSKPVIACVEDDCDIARIFERVHCGWIVPPEDMNGLRAVMENAYSTPVDTLKSMGENGYAFAMQNFTAQLNLNKLVNLIENELSGAGTY